MILLVGPPGAGKSLQAERLQNEYDVVWLSMGQLLRDSADEELQDILKRGDLVSDEMAQKVIFRAIKEVPPNKEILLDGFPRISSQAVWFQEFLKEAHRSLTAIVHLKVDEDTSVERLSQRGRMDDKEDIIHHRYRQYEREILPMVESFKQQGIRYYEIKGETSIDEVHKQIESAIGDLI